MNPPLPSVRAYRWLGCLAIAHALAVLALGFLVLREPDLQHIWSRTFLGLVTLWFLWPVVLALHRGRSALPGFLFACLGALVLLPSLRICDLIGPEALGLPMTVSLNPLSGWQYYSAYRSGRTEALKDIAAGTLATEEYGMPGPGLAHYIRIMRERNQIEVRRVAGCVVDEKIVGHAAGYNEISEPEINRRVGRDRVDAAREEGARLGAEEFAREEQFSKDLARRLSSLPPDGKITMESIKASVNQQPVFALGPEEELVQLVHAIETYLAAQVPKDTPPFRLYFRATTTPASSPTFEISSSDFAPRPVWDNIYKKLETIAAPKSTTVSLSVGLDFVIR